MHDPTFYGPDVDAVTALQTHISFIFLAGPHAYKVKKPVRFSFLDFSTSALRHRFCNEEVRLNRRLAADVYQATASIVASGSKFHLGAAEDTQALDYVVVMRRLDSRQMLSAQLSAGTVTLTDIDRIVDRLVPFYRGADRSDAVRRYGAPENVLASMDADFEEMRRFRGDTIDAADDERLAQYCRSEVTRWAETLARRAATGHVCEGHGDLHCDNVCLEASGVVIFDCIEFNPAFRCRDIASDIAFLAMDLEHYARPDLARHFVDRVSDELNDPQLPSLVPMFACHRAYIRGKVGSLKSAEPEVSPEERAEARATARSFFELALRYTWKGSSFLVVACGLSGTGKSSLARTLATRTGALHINSDVVRKTLAGLPLTSRVGRRDEAGLYSPAFSGRTYTEMFAQAEAALASGGRVILDGTFLRRVDRDAARALAERYGVPVLVVSCIAPEPEVVARLRERSAADVDASDADERVYRSQRRQAESIADEESGTSIVVDTTDELSAASRRVEERLRGARSLAR